jgi:hypothetical protein
MGRLRRHRHGGGSAAPQRAEILWVRISLRVCACRLHVEVSSSLAFPNTCKVCS